MTLSNIIPLTIKLNLKEKKIHVSKIVKIKVPLPKNSETETKFNREDSWNLEGGKNTTDFTKASFSDRQL